MHYLSTEDRIDLATTGSVSWSKYPTAEDARDARTRRARQRRAEDRQRQTGRPHAALRMWAD